MEDILIESVESGDERRTSPTQARKRRRTEKGKEQQYSDGNFSKFSKMINLTKLQFVSLKKSCQNHQFIDSVE